MYDNYIFDLYGTLVDIHTNENNPYLWKKLSLYMSLQGVVYAPQELKKAFRMAVEQERNVNYQRVLSQNCSVKLFEIEVDLSKVIAILYTRKNPSLTLSSAQIAHWALMFRTLSLKHLTLYPGAAELLFSLKKADKKVFLLSNAQRLFTEPEMRSLGIYHLFDDIFYSSDIGFTKPSPLFYRALLEKHSISPDRAVMVGNDDLADIWGAHKMQMDSYYIQTPQSPELLKPLPDNCTRISELSEIKISI